MFTRPPTTNRVETPTILQMEAAECGAAALGIILAYHGRWIPLPQLRRECSVSRHGVNALQLCKAAEAHGLEVQARKQTIASLQKQPAPFLIHWAFDHFLVVEGFEGERVYVNNPESGRTSVSLEEFNLAYTGVALLLQPGPSFRKEGGPPRIGPLLWGPLRQAPAGLLFCLIAGFLLVIPGLVAPVFTQFYVDEVLLKEHHELLPPLLLAMVVVAVVQTSLSLIQTRCQRYLHLKLSMGLASRFMGHVLRLPVDYFAQRYAGEISTRFRLTDHVAGFTVGPLATVALQVVLLVFYLGVMLAYDVLLSAVALAAALVQVYIMWKVTRRLLDFQLRLMQEGSRLGGMSLAGLQCIETLKASGQEGGFFTRWSGGYVRTLTAGQELGLADLKLGLWPLLFSSLTNTLVLVLGGLRVMDGQLTIGMLMAFLGLMNSFHSPLDHLLELGFQIQGMQVNLARLEDVYLNPVDPLTERPALPANGSAPRLDGLIEVRDVTFGYSPLHAPLLEKLSFTIRPGQKLAIVGASGSGKSTVAKLLAGLYEPWRGTIHLDGKPIGAWPRAVLANSLALVDQDITFFMGNVEDNLTLWDRSVAEKRLIRGCRDAVIHDVLLALPGGYRAQLNEAAGNLSGGQRQRLEIARALIQEPSILILDEATNSLDSETEHEIYRNIWARQCSCLIVAHRLSTVRECDEILVLENGRVAERGTHTELIRANGAYARLILSEDDQGLGD